MGQPLQGNGLNIEDNATIVSYGSRSQKTIIVTKSESVKNDIPDPANPALQSFQVPSWYSNSCVIFLQASEMVVCDIPSEISPSTSSHLLTLNPCSNIMIFEPCTCCISDFKSTYHIGIGASELNFLYCSKQTSNWLTTWIRTALCSSASFNFVATPKLQFKHFSTNLP